MAGACACCGVGTPGAQTQKEQYSFGGRRLAGCERGDWRECVVRCTLNPCRLTAEFGCLECGVWASQTRVWRLGLDNKHVDAEAQVPGACYLRKARMRGMPSKLGCKLSSAVARQTQGMARWPAGDVIVANLAYASSAVARQAQGMAHWPAGDVMVANLAYASDSFSFHCHTSV